MALTKPAGTWAYPDLGALPDDQTRYEIIDEELFEMPSPALAHAAAIMALIRLLLPLFDRMGGTLFTTTLDVFFAGADPVQPDIVAFLPGSRARSVRRGAEGHLICSSRYSAHPIVRMTRSASVSFTRVAACASTGSWTRIFAR